MIVKVEKNETNSSINIFSAIISKKKGRTKPESWQIFTEIIKITLKQYFVDIASIIIFI